MDTSCVINEQSDHSNKRIGKDNTGKQKRYKDGVSGKRETKKRATKQGGKKSEQKRKQNAQPCGSTSSFTSETARNKQTQCTWFEEQANKKNVQKMTEKWIRNTHKNKRGETTQMANNRNETNTNQQQEQKRVRLQTKKKNKQKKTDKIGTYRLAKNMFENILW